MLAAAVRGQVDIVKEALKKNACINKQTKFVSSTICYYKCFFCSKGNLINYITITLFICNVIFSWEVRYTNI